MSAQVWSNVRAFVNGYDFSGDINAVALKYGAELKDATSMLDTARQRRPGLKDTQLQLEGYVNYGTLLQDDQAFSAVGANDAVVSILPVGAGAEGNTGFCFIADGADYTPNAKIGDMLAYSLSANGSDELVRGTVMINAAKTLSGNGTGFQLGALAAGKKALAALHVLALTTAGSPSFACKLQSGSSGAFSSPTDYTVFSAMNAVGAQYATVATGPVTDAWWRVAYTLTNVSSITFAVVLGFQP
jgi:hypothetical protein